jgi:hypothetical protein
MRKKGTEVSIVNLSSYTSPKVKEVRNKEWVSYGDDNNYFQYLIDRYNGSPTNNAIINGISEMIYGKGLDATDSNKKPEQYAQAISLFHKDCVRKLAYDLKLMGQCAIQVIYSKDRKRVAQVEHLPIETLRAEKSNEKGDIEAYFYFSDWTKIKPSDKPKRIPAFGTSKESIEILYIKPYRAGFYYYSPVDYQGGLQYSELEEEISNYHLNNILNGLAPSMLINFNNGTPNEEERSLIEQRIYQKFSGSSNAGKFILAFNDDPQQQATIDPIQLSDAHNQYQFLSDESMRKIMVSHRVVSPMLLGIKDQSGLGNNADELKTASALMDNTVIRPFQNLLIDGFNQILAYNDIALNLYFKTLQPLEFVDLDETIIDKETKEEETGVKMSLKKIDGQEVYETKEEAIREAKNKGCEGYHEHKEGDKVWYMPCESHNDIKDEDLNTIADELIDLGEDEEELLKSYDIIDEMEVDYNQEERLDKMIGLASTGRAIPNAKSEQDGTSKQESQKGVIFQVRYQYAPLKTQQNSREFCKKMVSAKKVYRKEDILRMSDKPVNAGFGEGGTDTYSIWLYKGGARCHHKWFRKTYQLKEGKKSEISTTQARSKGFKPEVNEQQVPVAPNDMPRKGFSPNNTNLPKDVR